MKKQNILERIFLFILRKIGIIESKEISKKQMCESAKSQGICSNNCSCCIWNEEEV